MNKIKKHSIIFPLIFSFGLLFLSGAAWVNNLFVASKWYIAMSNGKLLTDVTGPIPFLDFLCVDMSGISTFIPFFGFLLVTIGILKIKRAQTISEAFPFFPAYDRLTIALGLIGTLWGIILIGYYPSGTVDLDSLMRCLHTSLYSTLISVGWVFIFLPVFRHFMHWWHRLIFEHTFADDDDDIIHLFDQLNTSVVSVGIGLNETTGEINTFRNSVSETKIELIEAIDSLKEFKNRSGIDAYEAITNVCSRIENSLKGLNVESESLRNAGNSMQEVVERMAVLIEQKTQDLNLLSEHLKLAEQKKSDAECKAENAVTDRLAAEEKVLAAQNKIEQIHNELITAEEKRIEAEKRIEKAVGARTETEKKMVTASERAEQAYNARSAAEERAMAALQRAEQISGERAAAQEKARVAEAKAEQAYKARLAAEEKATAAEKTVLAANEARLSAEEKADKYEYKSEKAMAQQIDAEEKAKTSEIKAELALKGKESAEKDAEVARKETSTVQGVIMKIKVALGGG